MTIGYHSSPKEQATPPHARGRSALSISATSPQKKSTCDTDHRSCYTILRSFCSKPSTLTELGNTASKIDTVTTSLQLSGVLIPLAITQKGILMTGHYDRVRTLPMLSPLMASKPAAAHPDTHSQTFIRKFAGVVLVTLALACCSVPVVILAMQTAEYVFGQ
jgi:hypothetical protein